MAAVNAAKLFSGVSFVCNLCFSYATHRLIYYELGQKLKFFEVSGVVGAEIEWGEGFCGLLGFTVVTKRQ